MLNIRRHVRVGFNVFNVRLAAHFIALELGRKNSWILLGRHDCCSFVFDLPQLCLENIDVAHKHNEFGKACWESIYP